ncbi:MAG: hypothetical protein H0X66_10370 [Verrucomicrobia bacterium]|nr:hypothetical protein [Verrucomicrobiota bacterium]
MGLLFIIPVLAISIWIIYSSYRALRRGEVSPVWRKRFKVMLVIGVVLGIYCAFLVEYQPNPVVGIKGFPVPTSIHRFENEVWKTNPFPLPIFVMAKLTNFLFGIAVALLPLKFAGMLNQVKPKDTGQL